MKKTTRFFTFALLVFIAMWILPQCISKQQQIDKIQSVITKIKSVYVPDKRVAIFNYEIKVSQNEILITGETTNPKALQIVEDTLKTLSNSVNFSINLLPDTTVAKNPFGIINLSVANIRHKPGHSNELVSQAILGTPVKLLKKKGYWNLIQTPDNYIGWVDGTAVLPLSKIDFNNWVSSKKIIYTKHSGFVYKTDNFNQPISDITAGSLLKLIKSTNKYFTVEFPDKRVGFVPKPDGEEFNLWMDSKDFTKESIIETAMPFLGHPYLWGGTSTKGVDCSGFTKTVYFLNGIVLQRDASQQELYGEAISTENNFEDLQEADLLFFGKAATDSTKMRVTHVGIYAGDLSFIHASGRVFFDSFDPNAENFNEYRKNTLLSVRRVLNSINNTGIQKITDNSYYTTQN